MGYLSYFPIFEGTCAGHSCHGVWSSFIVWRIQRKTDVSSVLCIVIWCQTVAIVTRSSSTSFSAADASDLYENGRYYLINHRSSFTSDQSLTCSSWSLSLLPGVVTRVCVAELSLSRLWLACDMTVAFLNEYSSVYPYLLMARWPILWGIFLKFNIVICFKYKRFLLNICRKYAAFDTISTTTF